MEGDGGRGRDGDDGGGVEGYGCEVGVDLCGEGGVAVGGDCGGGVECVGVVRGGGGQRSCGGEGGLCYIVGTL